MASGIPVIATEGGGTPEIVEDEYNGFLIKEFDSRKAFYCLCKAIEDEKLYKFLSVNALETIRSKFSIKKMVENYLELYKQL